MPSSVNPAERLPDSVIAYAEINLDPSFDQSPKVLDLIEAFGIDEEFESSEDLIELTLEDLDLDGVESDQLTSWVGTRGAIGFIGDDLEEASAIVAIASTNDEAAEDGLAAIAEVAGEESVDFVVDDGLAVIVAGAGDVSGKAEDVVEAGRESPLADNERYAADAKWLDDDQLLTVWVDYAAGMDLMTELMDIAATSGASPGTLPESFDTDELMQMYGDYETFVLGVRATGDGVDVRYRGTGGDSDQPGNAEWRAEVGDLRLGEIAGTATLLDLTDIADMQAGMLEDLESAATPGLWTYDEALSESEAAEYEDLVAAQDSGELSFDDADFDRLWELEQRHYWYGEQSDYDSFIAGGGTDDEWFSSQALTAAEGEEYWALSDQYWADELSGEDEERYQELDGRYYGFGFQSDYEEQVDIAAAIDELYGYLSGGTITAVVSGIAGDEVDLGLEFVVADGAADRILDLPIPGWSEIVPEIESQLEFDGSSLTFGELTGGDETMADHELFDTVFNGAPDEASVALFADVTAIVESVPGADDFGPVRAVGFVHASNGEGLLRVIIDN
jgi:hypothetical protein